jgi:hypothetical protein
MTVKEIIHARMPLQEKADKIFGKSDSEAKNIFIKLYLSDGGLVPAVKILGMDRQFESYQKKFEEACEKDDTKKAVMLLSNFKSKILFQLALKFKI